MLRDLDHAMGDFDPSAQQPANPTPPELPLRWTMDDRASDLAEEVSRGKRLRDLHHHRSFSKDHTTPEALAGAEITQLFEKTVDRLQDHRNSEALLPMFWLDFTALFDSDIRIWSLVHERYLNILVQRCDICTLQRVFSESIPDPSLQTWRTAALLGIAIEYLIDKPEKSLQFEDTFCLESLFGAGVGIIQNHDDEIGHLQLRVAGLEGQIANPPSIFRGLAWFALPTVIFLALIGRGKLLRW